MKRTSFYFLYCVVVFYTALPGLCTKETLTWWDRFLHSALTRDASDTWPNNASFYVVDASGTRVFNGQAIVDSCSAKTYCTSKTTFDAARGEIQHLDIKTEAYAGGTGGCGEAWVFVANSDALLNGITTWVQSVRMYTKVPRDIVGIVTAGVSKSAIRYLSDCLKVTVKVAPAPVIQMCPPGSNKGTGHNNCFVNRVKQYTNQLLIALLDEYCRVVYSVNSR